MNVLVNLEEALGRRATETETTQVSRWVNKDQIVPHHRGYGSGSRHTYTPSQARLLRHLIDTIHPALLDAFGANNGPPHGLIRAIWDDLSEWPVDPPYPMWRHYSYSLGRWWSGLNPATITITVPTRGRP